MLAAGTPRRRPARRGRRPGRPSARSGWPGRAPSPGCGGRSGSAPRSQRMKLIVGPRSRWPGKYRKSLTISPRCVQVPVQRLEVLRGLQHHVAEALHPRRLPRRALGGVDARRVVPDVEHQCGAGRAARAVRACRRPRAPGPRSGRSGRRRARRWLSGSARVGAFGPVGEPQHVDLVAGPERRAARSESAGRGARSRTARRRRCRAAAARRDRAQAVWNPNARANASARARSGFSNSSQARSTTLMTGLRDRPGCSPGSAPRSLCRSRCASSPVVSMSDHDVSLRN